MKKMFIDVVGIMLIAGVAIGAPNLVPSSSGAGNLGTATLPWGTVYANAQTNSAMSVADNGTLTLGTNVTVTLGAGATVTSSGPITLTDGSLAWADVAGLTATTTEVNRITVNTNLFVSSFSAVAVTNYPFGTTNTVTVTAKNWMGNTLTTNCLFHVWFAVTDMGVPAALDTEVTVTTGAEIQQITDKAIYDVMTTNTGVAVLRLENNAAETNYMMIKNGGGVVTSTKLVWPLP